VDKFARREFLRKTVEALAYASGIQGLMATPSFAGNPATAAGATGSAAYKIGDWKGDDFTLGHELRNRRLPAFPANAERTVDFAIIGGGMSGLSSAYYLRDHDYLLLEQYQDLGGQSRGSSFQGIGYSYGAAYVGPLEGELERLVHDLGLKSVAMEPEKNSWRWENQWVSGITGDAKAFHKEFKHLREFASPTWENLKKCNWQLMPLAGQDMERLDQSTFASVLTGFDPKFISLLDGFLRSCNCLGVEKTSALAGLSIISDLVESNNVFPGGNPTLAGALAARLAPERCLTGTFVWSIEVKEHGASIVYSTKDGATHRVNCRFAIVCTPPMVCARLLKGIGDESKAGMLGFKYGSYLVANLLMKKEVFKGPYDSLVSDPFTFTDIVKAEKPYQMTNGAYKESMGSVLTIYQPYEPGSIGRPALLKGDRDAFATSIVSQMHGLVGDIDRHIEEIVLSRWGHAMVVPACGFFQKMTKLNATISGAYTLAHCSSQGLPCAETAIAAARLAATKALNSKSTTMNFDFAGNPIASQVTN
jgi:hypothetical protein